MIRFLLNKLTPSLNVTDRQHWAAKKKERNHWASLILGKIRQHDIQKATGKRRLTITRVNTRLLDNDNLYGGAKGLVDELRLFGLVIDDKPEFCELIVQQEKCANGLSPHTVVCLEDL